MLLRCALDLQAMGKCGVRSISTTARVGVVLKPTVKGRGGATLPQQSRAMLARKDQDETGLPGKKFPRRPLMARWPQERGVLEPRRSEMKCVQVVLSLKEWGLKLEGPSTYPTY